jgi:hypothetical protein
MDPEGFPMQRIVHSIRHLALLLALAGLASSGSAQAANLHLIIAADTSQEAGLGGDVLADKNSVKQLFQQQVPANRLDVHVLDRSQMSPTGILQAVQNLKVAPREDSVVFYYTGHGAFDKSKGHFFSLPNRQQLLRSQLRDALIKQEPKTAVMITDCCAAGARFRGTPKALTAKAGPPVISPLLKYLLFEQSGYISITSSKPGEVSLTRGDGKGSVFTYPFVKYLDANRDNVLSWDKIIDDVKVTVQNDFDRVTKRKGVDSNGDNRPDQWTQTVHPFVLTPRLGMRVQEQNGNLVITEVVPLSPAFHAGLEVGDHLLAINEQPLRTEREYDAAVDNSPRQMVLKVFDPNKQISGNPTAQLNP